MIKRRKHSTTHGSKSGDYPIGYGRPPREHQFKPGQSGNPKGRRRGSKSLSTILAQELDEVITIKENGTTRRITKRQAIAKQLMNRVIFGDQRALKVFLDYFAIADEKEDPAVLAEREESSRRMYEWMNKVAARKAAGEEI